MRKVQLLLVAVSCLLVTQSYAQWTTSGNDIYNSNSGNVGIGTTTPATKLDINGNLTLRKDANNYTANTITMLNPVNAVNSKLNSSNQGFEFFTTSNHPIIFGVNNVAVTAWHTSGNFRISPTNPQFNDNGSRLQVDGSAWIDGNVGIGTTAATAKLHVAGTFKLVDGTQGANKVLISDANGMASWAAPGTIGGGLWSDAGSGNLYNTTLTGNVSIGVSAVPSGYRFAVGGGIIAEKVKVKLQSAIWPDYVFNKEYDLPTLKETEQFIQQNQHLSGVPSAATIEKEGLDLGDGQAVLLKKIEELTLHMIEVNKKVERLEQENVMMKKKLEKK